MANEKDISTTLKDVILVSFKPDLNCFPEVLFWNLLVQRNLNHGIFSTFLVVEI